MKAVIVFESMFGNTESLAAEVRDGLLEGGADAVLVEVGAATSGVLDDCDLLVVAAPTHALSLSRPQSRAEAVLKGADPSRAAIGVREWLDGLGRATSDRRPPAVVFDTRVFKARYWSGSAAGRASRALRRQGFAVVGRSSFFVDEVTGPLTPGESRRARAWGRELATSAQSAERADTA